MSGTIVVSGAPGSGKTALCAQLCRLTGLPVSVTPEGPDAACRIDMLRMEQAVPGSTMPVDSSKSPAIIEQSAYGPGYHGEVNHHLVVIDAVRALKSPGFDAPNNSPSPADADLVVVSKGDLIDDLEVLTRVRERTEAPVVSAHHGKLAEDAHPPGNRRTLHLPDNPVSPFWSYSGAASFSEKIADYFLVQRPPGILRLKGRVISGATGLDLDLSGRARSITPCAKPEETILFATGDPSAFRESELVRHFAETASSEAAGRRLFAWR